MYRIEVDRTTGVLFLHISGFVELEEARQMTRDVLQAADNIRKIRNRVLVACVSDGDLNAAPPESMAEFIKCREALVIGPGDRMANVVSSALVRMQFERLGQPDQVKTFGTLDEAKQWLLA